ncbi:unnamed protein product, partial [Closterium sp. NIES-65]
MGQSQSLSLVEASELIRQQLSADVFVSHLLAVEPHSWRRPPLPHSGLIVCEVEVDERGVPVASSKDYVPTERPGRSQQFLLQPITCWNGASCRFCHSQG